MPLEFVESQRGCKLLVDEGHLLVKQRENAASVTWRCKQCAKGCSARVFTSNMKCSGKILKRKGEHQDAPNRAEIEAMKIMVEGKKMVKVDKGPISHVVSHICGKADRATAARLPDIDDIKRTLGSHRAKTNPVPVNPNPVYELTETDEFTQTLKGEKWLFWDSLCEVKSTRTLVFTTNSNLEVLSSYGTWFADGTFDCVPHLFQQLYTIHGVRDGFQSVPLVYILTTSKSEKTYKDVLIRMKERQSGLLPEKVTCYFELAFHNAVKYVFPDAIVKCCFFHFAQCVWLKIEQNGLQKKYSDDAMFALYLHQLIAMAFVPHDEVSSMTLYANLIFLLIMMSY